MEKFSVLISVYSKETPEWFRASLDSVFDQTVMPDEVVIVKDGPLTADLDAVVDEAVARHPQIKVVALDKNQGLGHALNEGLRHCSHCLVARMDSDDICKPTRFERELKEFSLDPMLDVCGSWLDEFVGNPDHVAFVKRLPEHQEELYEYGKRRNPVNHPSCMFRKQAVIDAGGYIALPLFEDYYLWTRMMMSGCRFRCIQESLLFFRMSMDTIKRRGGLRYACNELKLQYKMMRMGYISLPLFVRNTLMRITARLMPCSLRKQLYVQIRKH